MRQFRCTKSFIFFLLFSFLGMQASSAHIHLPAHHDHDGSHHQHEPQGHAHNLASHHDSLDDAPTQGQHNVVELDHDCTSQAWNTLDDHIDAVIATVPQRFYPGKFVHVSLPTKKNHVSSWLAYSSIWQRAPPRFTSIN